MTDNDIQGRPASELSDEELEQQGTQAHATRNWVFLHGSAEQFARHTTRMLELEREYLRRFPKRTWQGSGGAVGNREATAEAWRETVLGIVEQLTALLKLPDPKPAGPVADPAETFLLRVADADGRMHKLEAHQVAREVGLERAALAGLYKADPPLLTTEGHDRVLTAAGRARLTTGAA
ncbi:hypothetical protein HC031_29240 [Planosporangium thailandense]|uniref:Uncharacterized protein n=1 Tax=Planosporangium thailandense TaxID=765197 RepID=A0ABX0Y606_9ACTN|nr:DUF6158 family protein [Planosporangium thailandense]NJC73768.1 hypothetical protein [Planosporangium thailandense]